MHDRLTIATRWRVPLLRLFAVLLLAAQTAGLVHAADLDAHAQGDVCQICQHQDRSSAPPPAAPLDVTVVGADGHLRIEAPAEAAVAAVCFRPPSRAPPPISASV